MILIKWEYKEICEFLAVDIYEIVDIYWVLEGLNKVIQVYQTVTHFLLSSTEYLMTSQMAPFFSSTLWALSIGIFHF